MCVMVVCLVMHSQLRFESPLSVMLEGELTPVSWASLASELDRVVPLPAGQQHLDAQHTRSSEHSHKLAEAAAAPLSPASVGLERHDRRGGRNGPADASLKGMLAKETGAGAAALWGVVPRDPDVIPPGGLPPFWAWPEEGHKAGTLPQAAWFWENVLLPASGLPKPEQARLLSWVVDGVDIPSFMHPFTGDFAGKAYSECKFPPPSAARNHKIEEARLKDFITAEIARLVDSGAVSIWKGPRKPRILLPVGVEPNKPRMVIDARYLNCWTPSPSFRYDTLRQFQQGIDKGDWLFSLDHKAGYHHVCLTERSRELMGFAWGGKTYVFHVLPFGWAPACFVYQKLSTVVVGYIRRASIHGMVYLDDCGLALRKCTQLWYRYKAVFFVLAVMYLAGYCVARKKSSLHPDTALFLLGFGMDTVRQCYFVPVPKMIELLDLIVGAVGAKGRRIPLVSLQRIVGKAQARVLALPPIALFLRSSWDLMSEFTHSSDPWVCLSDEVCEDLLQLSRWREWLFLSHWPQERHMSLRLETDASGIAWGAVLYTPNGEARKVRGEFAPGEMAFLIHVKEAWAVTHSLDHFAEYIRDCFLNLYTDNSIVQASLLRGSSRDPDVRACSKALLEFEVKTRVIVRVFRVATEENVVPDRESRLYVEPPPGAFDPSDHCLARPLFEWVQLRAGPFTLDVCASSASTQLPRFMSRVECLPADERCVGVNAFMSQFPTRAPVGRERLYCYPPWALISGLWRHFRLCRAAGVMLAPRSPDKPWFGSLMRDAVEVLVVARAGMAGVWTTAAGTPAHPLAVDLLGFVFDFSDCVRLD